MQNYNTIIFAVAVGVLPALLWLWFWLKEDSEHPEPKGLLFFTFILGALSIFVVLPLEKFAKTQLTDKNHLIIAWAAIEEIMKYMAVALIALKSRYLEEPIDFPMYFITSALGFAAIENILFLYHPGALGGDTTVNLITGNLRFLGATLLHAVASGMIGAGLGLAFGKEWFVRKFYLIGGIIMAIGLHSTFNFFIIKNNGEDYLKVFGFLWVLTIIFILIMEKLRRINPDKVIINNSAPSGQEPA